MARGEGPEIGDLLGMGSSITGCLIVGFGLGWLVDHGLGSFPVGALIGLFLGIVAACFYMYGQFKKFM
ncbi:AtpZ/AtpI family protein [Pseudonocardia spinosispora]|uniref:AtpZ/AtpI family protein n=1 Tax=Pseudonocardia spinosispora TaxID=103441 RepID=UPI0003FC6DA8|nr:AtpZ/AtpI family protein [Pseudonocardia spinosispora]